MIKTTYSEFLIEEIIKDLLKQGEQPTPTKITSELESFTASNDISNPIFNSTTSSVAQSEVSSVAKYNTANSNIQLDLQVLFRHLFKVSDQAINRFNRWRNEADLLEGRLKDLSEKISSLLLISSDTAGFFNFVQDNFVDNSKTDLANTTAYVNVDKELLSIGTSSSGATRIDTSSLKQENIEFTVLTRKNFVSSVSVQGSTELNIVSDVNSFWQERIYTNKPEAVTAELKIDLLETKQVSRVDVDLHIANQNSSIQVTPLYSTDNYNWKQLPVTNPTRSILDRSIFQFSPVSMRYVKFIMTKPGFDQVHNELYAYEFGIDEIAFYKEGFSTSTSSTFISQPLSILDTTGNTEEFNRLVLEVCEDVPDDTKIEYYVATSNDSSHPISSANFVSIDPLNRENSTKPTVLDFGDLSSTTVSGINISYNASSTEDLLINPAQDFTLVTSPTTTSSASSSTVSGVRYSFNNSNDRILDHQVASGVIVVEDTIELWRNVNVKGTELKVRGYINGWGFEEPYYKTTVYVSAAEGYSLDFGSKPIILDEEPLTGKQTISKGNHSVWVHKDNWKAIITSSVSDLSSLKAADKLYPYNHRYLVEGFNYPTDYPTDEEKIYRGFDIVAEHLMKRVSPFDIANNVPSTDYSKYALDTDTGDAGRLVGGSPALDTSPNKVFVLKIDDTVADSTNELFTLKFKSANELFKYIRFKAVLSTSDTEVTPFLDSYRIKISS